MSQNVNRLYVFLFSFPRSGPLPCFISELMSKTMSITGIFNVLDDRGSISGRASDFSLLRVVQRQGREADDSSPSSTQTEIGGAITPLPHTPS
jgi:hypothetical protein